MLRSVFFLLLLFIAVRALPQNTDGVIAGKETVLTIPPGPDNPRNSEGDFITLKSGKILYIYSHFTGSTFMDDDPAYLASRFSTDNGKTWSKTDEVVVRHEGRGNLMSVSLLRLHNGQIALFYVKKNSSWDCIPWMQLSDDEAKSWHAPVRCITDEEGYFVVNNNRVIQLKNGRLLMPVSKHDVKEGGEWNKDSEMGRIFCYFSDDNGETWSRGDEVPNPDHVLHQEPGVVQLSNGNIFMVIRSDANAQYVSYSADNGKSWTPSKISDIYSPVSPASIARAPHSRTLVLVWNNNHGDNPLIKGMRTPLTIAISKNNGRTWNNKKNIEDNPHGSFCYSAIHFSRNSILLGYFDWSTRQITIKRLSRQWVYK